MNLMQMKKQALETIEKEQKKLSAIEVLLSLETQETEETEAVQSPIKGQSKSFATKVINGAMRYPEQKFTARQVAEFIKAPPSKMSQVKNAVDRAASRNLLKKFKQPFNQATLYSNR